MFVNSIIKQGNIEITQLMNSISKNMPESIIFEIISLTDEKHVSKIS